MSNFVARITTEYDDSVAYDPNNEGTQFVVIDDILTFQESINYAKANNTNIKIVCGTHTRILEILYKVQEAGYSLRIARRGERFGVIIYDTIYAYLNKGE